MPSGRPTLGRDNVPSCTYAPPTAISRRNTHWEDSLSMISHTYNPIVFSHTHPWLWTIYHIFMIKSTSKSTFPRALALYPEFRCLCGYKPRIMSSVACVTTCALTSMTHSPSTPCPFCVFAPLPSQRMYSRWFIKARHRVYADNSRFEILGYIIQPATKQ